MKALSFILSAVFVMSTFMGAVPETTFAADKKVVEKTESSAAAKAVAVKSTKTGDKTKSVVKNIDVNVADAETLCLIPGIGPKTAEAIIKQRNSVGKFKSVDELLAIKGIGEKSLQKMKPYLQNI